MHSHSRNFIQTVPVEVCRMKLKALNLSNNRLVSIPVEFGKLGYLQYLVSHIHPY